MKLMMKLESWIVVIAIMYFALNSGFYRKMFVLFARLLFLELSDAVY